MSKVAKNIKKFRNTINMSQEEVAKSLFVTRQTISGWENGRTQPDIDTLCKLAELFNVSVEDLIYGEKRFTTQEEKEQASKRNLITAFSVIASVLVAVGASLIFFNYWETMHTAYKTIFGFIPLLATQALALYTFIRKRESVLWRECVSVAWCTGIMCTIALMDNIFQMQTDFADCVFIDSLLILPIVFIFDAVSPLFVYFASVTAYNIVSIGRSTEIINISSSILLFAAGLAYIILNRKSTHGKHIFTRWVALITGGFLYFSVLMILDLPEITVYGALTALFIIIGTIDRSFSFASPFAPLNVLSTAAMALFSSIMLNPDILYSSERNKLAGIITLVITVMAVVAAAIVRRKIIFTDKIRTIYFAASAVMLLSQMMCIFLYRTDYHIFAYLPVVVSSLVIAFALIADGILKRKLFVFNIGLLLIIGLLCVVIVQFVDISLPGAGILLLFFGSILFATNVFITKKIKPKKEDADNE